MIGGIQKGLELHHCMFFTVIDCNINNIYNLILIFEKNNFSFIFFPVVLATKQSLPGGKHGKDERVQQQFINTVRCARCKK